MFVANSHLSHHNNIVCGGRQLIVAIRYRGCGYLHPSCVSLTDYTGSNSDTTFLYAAGMSTIAIATIIPAELKVGHFFEVELLFNVFFFSYFAEQKTKKSHSSGLFSKFI